ncbi:MATE family efflux transporter [Tissierella creatinophila]|uniref:Multidrug export protein MepA n=1 Tax=Tissierella creatinophila DSM 6911 TaxID=1123403 RepID=A0A1U7M2R5_TISCR|nr:MATE family efflux transporter [Tissierella creatinophila]OLS01509.1 multidrug export protein MepA [Tissierella creatinophila DSM 6911]
MKDQTNENRLGTEPILPLLIKLSIPSIFSMTIQALYNIVDSIYVGRYSVNGLSALSLAFPLEMFLISIAVGTGVGGSSLISRLLGKRKTEKASRVAEHVLLLSVLYGIIVAIIGIFFSRDLISLFTDDQALIQMATDYVRIMFIGSTFLFVPILSSDILRGEGNTLVPMVAMLIGAIINIVLDPFLIFGKGPFPELGAAGAAYATLFSRFVSGIYIIYMVLNNDKDIKVDRKEFKFNFKIIKDIYKVGLPAMIMQFLGSFMVAGLNLIVGSYNNDAIAVIGIYFKLQSFVFMPIFGLNQGYMPIVGYNYGFNKPDRMKEAIKYGLLTAFVITTFGFLLFQFIPVTLVSLFNDDPKLIKLGVHALKTISLAFPIIGIAIVASTTFQAVGRGFISLIISFLRQIIILLPAAYVLGKVGGLDYIWYAFPISELISGVVLAILFITVFSKVFQNMTERNSQ